MWPRAFAGEYCTESQAKIDQLMTLDALYTRILIGAIMHDVDNMFSALAFKKGEQKYQSEKRDQDKDLAEL